jgi:type I restriction enzyme S subunit
MAVENLITEHLDIWTSAIKAKSAAGRGSSKKLELVGVKKLRELILELAVRGKLVPQDPNDEPASELLKKIVAEKTRLIKEGKIKKQKPLPPISDDEKPFNLPNGWDWLCWAEILAYDNAAFKRGPFGSSLTKSMFISEGYKVYEQYCPINDDCSFERYYITDEKFNELKGFAVKEGDFLVSCTGATLGRITQVPSNFKEGIINQALLRVRINNTYIDSAFFKLLFRSPYFQKSIFANSKGSAIPNVKGVADLKVMLVPFLPFKEQQRIVAKVDELMVLCDQLEAQTEASIDAHKTLLEVLLTTLTDAKDADELNDNWQTISQHFDLLFTTQASIDQLKQTILQLAVMGKLVKQDPKDEPASKLLERIATEKQQLIKDGKIKKQKPLPPITDEEKPFELPSGWEWAYLNSLLPQFQNGASSRGDKDGKDVIVLRLADIKNWKISLNDTRTLEIAEETIKRYSLKKGDVLIIRVNGSADIVGRFITCESDLDTIYCDHFIRMNFPIECLFSPYLSLLGSSDLIRSRIANLFVSTAGQKTVNQTHIGTLPISLPPLAEQQRIVVKVDELLALCDSLKANLNQAQTTQLHLTGAIVEQTL